MNAIEDERRRYFRMDDLIGMRFRPLSDDETQQASQAKPSSLKSLLSQMDEEITVALSRTQKSDPEAYHIMSLFNQKLNLIMGHGLIGGDESLASLRACRVNLSACGIAFPSASAVELNQYIEIELSLNQGNMHITLIAAVIACEGYVDKVNNHTHLIRADFSNISDVDQEHLIQYVIKRQAQQLSDQREARL